MTEPGFTINPDALQVWINQLNSTLTTLRSEGIIFANGAAVAAAKNPNLLPTADLRAGYVATVRQVGSDLDLMLATYQRWHDALQQTVAEYTSADQPIG
ncbi:MAG: hypothetical protein ACR2KJ_09030 [Jatrophihabitans sp.]